MNDYELIRLEKHVDERGELYVAEPFKNIPFDIRRVFWVMNAPDGTRRAGHAHKECRQVLVGLQGDIDIHLTFQDRKVMDISMSGNSGIGLLVEPGVRIDYMLSGDAIMLVLASKPYDVGDYFSFMEEEYVVTSLVSDTVNP